MKKLLLIIAISTLFVNLSFAQSDEENHNRKFGFTASLQFDQLDFLVPFWITDKLTVAPSLSVVSAQEIGSDITIGVQPKLYLSEPEKAALFVAARGGVIIGMPSEGDNIYDFLVGAGLGGEYFLDQNFSLSIELQGNFTISDEGSIRFGNSGNLNFNTATVISASIYF